MTNNINLASTEPLNSAKTGMLSKAKAGTEGPNGLNTEDSLDSEDSFMASMLKLAVDPTTTDEALDLSAGGNILPISGNSIENTAENDPPLLLSSLNLQNINNEQVTQPITQPVINAEKSLVLDSDIVDSSMKMSSEGKLLSSSIRQLLQSETKEQGQNTLTKTGNTSSINVTTDNAVTRQAEAPLIKLDNLDLVSQKTPLSAQLPGQLSLMSTQQQLPMADSQSALLQQSSSSFVETGNAQLTTSLNPVTNNFSSMSQATMPQTEITEPFGRPAWAQGMGKQILWMANQNISSAEIRLNPAHLGPIEVRLDISDDQINVALSSRHANVREAMEMALPKLRDMFDSNGLSLADTDISHQSFAQQREQNTANGQGNIINNNAGHSDFVNQDEAVINQSQLSTSMVDYYI
jgi:flagellar hook-length control protein FliK